MCTGTEEAERCGATSGICGGQVLSGVSAYQAWGSDPHRGDDPGDSGVL